MEQTTGTTSSSDAATQPQGEVQQAADDTPDLSGFGSRGRARRRARFLRKARELAYRDLGGLIFDLHRFGERNDALVLAKLDRLAGIDGELRTLERALGERQTITVLREAGLTACVRCAAIHGSEDRFCPNCGVSLGRHPDLPIAGGPTSATAPATPPPAPAAAATSAPQPTPGTGQTPTHEAPAAAKREPQASEEPTEIIQPPASGA